MKANFDNLDKNVKTDLDNAPSATADPLGEFQIKKTISLTNFPAKAHEMVVEEAKRRGVFPKQLYWDGLRAMGLALPEYSDIYRKNKSQ